jgi:hypothetical protein
MSSIKWVIFEIVDSVVGVYCDAVIFFASCRDKDIDLKCLNNLQHLIIFDQRYYPHIILTILAYDES